MNKYWKAWGGLAGGVVGVLAVHGIVPQETAQQLPALVNTFLPVLASIVGTVIAPKNKY